MVSNDFSSDRRSNRKKMSSKIVIAGGFGAGKTTLVRSVSEIPPVTTEAIMTEASVGHDDTSITPDKTTTTVAMDFGRITIDDELVMYMFGTPGQARFWFMWDDLVRGAIGAIVLVDTRRLADSFAALDFFEERGLPYIVAVNCFDGVLRHEIEDVREALVIDQRRPIVPCDARNRKSVKQALISVTEHAVAEVTEPATAQAR